MIARIVRFFLGSSRFVCPEGELLGVLDALMRAEIPYDEMRLDTSGYGHFRVFLSDRERVRAVCADYSGLRIEAESGLPHLLFRYRRRLGIPVGAFLFGLLVWMSSHVIWSMDVKGNDTVSDVVIKENLEKLGCGIGSYIPNLDLWQVCNRYLLLNDDLAFISVNMEGTVAHVEVMERQAKQSSEWEPSDDGAPSNLVAARDGQIVRYEVSSGQASVKVHDVVRKGELLVSGVVNTKKNPDNTFRLERAVGRVYARTKRQISVSVPLKQTQLVPFREETLERSLIFFSSSLKVFKKGGKIPTGYDIITEKKQWVLFRDWPILSPVSLPIFSERTVGVYRKEQTKTLSEEEAKQEAYAKLWAEHEKVLQDTETVRYEITEGLSPDGSAYEINMWVECIENIAVEVPIQLRDLG